MTAGAFCKTFLASLSFAFSALLLPTTSSAQIDPTSGMLLDSTGRPSSRDDKLDSGRYTVRPKSAPKKQPNPSASATATATATAVAQPTPVPAATPILEETVVVQAQATATATVATPTVATPTPAPEETPSVKPIEKKVKAPAYDRRDSILELSLSPVYIYTDSKSTYWHRAYQTSSPGGHLNANVWLSERFGLHTSFMTSLGASVTDSVNQSREVEASHNWFDIGVRFRHFASEKPKSSALILGIDWSEYRFTPSPSSQVRQRLLTSGAQIKAGIEFPTSKSYMWTADVSLLPKARHLELDTRATVRSGSSNETNTFGASLGGVIRIDSGNAYFWRFSHKIEKNVFDGMANSVDPISGITPTGVSVTNSSTLFEIGCTWGD